MASLFLFVLQGILHTGKGSITLSPYHTDRTLMSSVAVSGLLGTLVAALDVSNVLLKANHFMLYHLALAMYPRILSTFDEDLKPITALVRVGNAVDTVGQAGASLKALLRSSIEGTGVRGARAEFSCT